MPEVAGVGLVSAARHWVVEQLQGRGVSVEGANAVSLVTGELVTNALLHADGPFAVAIETERGCSRVEVWDSSPAVDAVRRAVPHAPDEIGGWGLALVDRLSTRWGVCRADRQKCVWAEIRDAALGS
jgi:anti-sigma regulatory factor (Ser/Thr protein kinase)